MTKRKNPEDHPLAATTPDFLVTQLKGGEKRERQVLARRIPTICVLLSALFQKCVSYFTVYMLLL
jgi:hypothetical protein